MTQEERHPDFDRDFPEKDAENAQNVENSEVPKDDLNKGRGADLAQQELNNLGAKKKISTNSTSRVRKKRWQGRKKKAVNGDEDNEKGKRRKKKVVDNVEVNGKGKGIKKVVDGDEDNHSATSEDPDWLLEGLEGSEDEDIFKNSRDCTSQCEEELEGSEFQEGASHSQGQSHPKGGSSSQEHLHTQNTEHNQCYEEEFVENFDPEPWNERVFNEEDLLDTQLNDEEGYPAQVQHEFNAETEYRKAEFELKVGQKFRNLLVFREALVEWHVREGYVFNYERNERAKVTVYCKNGCGWRLHASPIQDTSTFQIKTIRGSHSCGREYNNPHATSTYLSKKLQHRIRDDPKISLEGLVSSCKRECMVNISLKQAYWIRRKAIESMQGCDMEQYHRVRDYASAILNYIPGSRVTIQVQKTGENDIGTFHRMYWGLGALKDTSTSMDSITF